MNGKHVQKVGYDQNDLDPGWLTHITRFRVVAHNCDDWTSAS